MKHIGLAGGPLVSQPFSLDFRIFIYKKKEALEQLICLALSVSQLGRG